MGGATREYDPVASVMKSMPCPKSWSRCADVRVSDDAKTVSFPPPPPRMSMAVGTEPTVKVVPWLLWCG